MIAWFLKICCFPNANLYRYTLEECDELAKARGLCKRHGGAQYKKCTEEVGTGGLCRAGTYPKLHAPICSDVPKISPKHPK